MCILSHYACGLVIGRKSRKLKLIKRRKSEIIDCNIWLSECWFTAIFHMYNWHTIGDVVCFLPKHHCPVIYITLNSIRLTENIKSIAPVRLMILEVHELLISDDLADWFKQICKLFDAAWASWDGDRDPKLIDSQRIPKNWK